MSRSNSNSPASTSADDIRKFSKAASSAMHHKNFHEATNAMIQLVLAIEHASGFRQESVVYGKALHNLGFVLKVTNDFHGAQKAFRKAYAVRKAILGEGHYDTLTTLSSLGTMCVLLNEIDRAVQVFEKVFEGRMKLFGPKNPLSISALRSLITCQRKRGEHQLASMLERMLPSSARPRQQHPTTHSASLMMSPRISHGTFESIDEDSVDEITDLEPAAWDSYDSFSDTDSVSSSTSGNHTSRRLDDEQEFPSFRTPSGGYYVSTEHPRARPPELPRGLDDFAEDDFL